MINRVLTLGVFVLIMGGLFAAPAISATIIGDDDVRLSKNITDDVYIFGGSVTVAGDIHGDLVIGGGNVRVTGNVDGDLMIGGGQITIDGRMRDTVRIGGDLVASEQLGSVAKSAETSKHQSSASRLTTRPASAEN